MVGSSCFIPINKSTSFGYTEPQPTSMHFCGTELSVPWRYWYLAGFLDVFFFGGKMWFPEILWFFRFN
jgi:hypothetical protein